MWLAPGFSYAEQFVGTNGIGTALEARGPAQVFGHEHYVERLEELACAGAPIRHPVTGKVLGVIDLTCWQRDAGPLLIATAGTLTRRIEAMLLEQSGERELAVLNDYLVACRRNRGPVLALGEDLLMMNDRARELLDPADQEPLLAEASEALADGRRHPLLVDLPSGRTARVCTAGRRVSGSGIVGGVLDVQLISPLPAGGARGRAARRPRRCSAAVGSGRGLDQVLRRGRTATCARGVARARGGAGHRAARPWPGPPTSARTPAARLRVLAAEDAGPDSRSLSGRGARAPAAARWCSPTSTSCRRRS